MNRLSVHDRPALARPRTAVWRRRGAWLALLLPLLAGCSGFRPLAGIPPNYVPREIVAVSRNGKKTIDLSLLRQSPPREYRVGPGDVLGIYIEGVLGKVDDAPPVHFPQDREQLPSVGYPITVREDGTISLPMMPSIPVAGLSFRDVEARLRQAFTRDHPILREGQDRILVSLHKPRTYRVLVMRQEAGNSQGNLGTFGMPISYQEKRGIGRVVALPAYRNDVLNALAETGGLPGLDTDNVVYIMRRRGPGDAVSQKRREQPRLRGLAMIDQPLPSAANPYETERPALPAPLFAAPGAAPATSVAPVPGPPLPNAPDQPAIRSEQAPAAGTPAAWPPDVQNGSAPAFPPDAVAPGGQNPGFPGEWPDGLTPPDVPFSAGDATIASTDVLKIPLRLVPGEAPAFSEADIVLRDGDVVFLESREQEYFFTAGLLGGGQYVLPRDYDLDVLGAIAVAESHARSWSNRPAKTVGGVSALNQDVTVGASQVVILRKLPDGQEVPIRVDLNRAIRNPRDRVMIQPGDRVVLEYTRIEALAAFVERHFFDGFVFGAVASQFFNRD